MYWRKRVSSLWTELGGARVTLPQATSMSSLDQVHEVPADVLRLLLEHSASADRTLAAVLGLVSCQVQSWTDPHLFRFLLHTKKGNFKILDEMASPNASPRLMRARFYVHSLTHLFEMRKRSLLQGYLTLLPNLQSLCLWMTPFPVDGHKKTFDFTQVHPSLRRMCFTLPGLYRLAEDAFSHPFWSNITHLHISLESNFSATFSSFAREELFGTMFNLTHLAFSDLEAEEDDIETALSRVIASLPPSLKLCLLPVLQSKSLFGNVDGERWNQIIQGQLDERIVVYWHNHIKFIPPVSEEYMVQMDVATSLQLWYDLRDGIESFWERGEAILEKRSSRQDMTTQLS
ncbi:hypothetical protein DL96DRAFT_1620298 [Flagelloscypha sp. PMI_526]|nr:hypothetical protein DL96DRAFT_1620298 [Flagelloscypha sp. PMI_526]